MNKNLKQNKKNIFSFMEKNPLAVISTVYKESNKPESALVAFSQTKDLELIFQTQNDTRKFKNIKTNPYVSFVIGWNDKKHITLQYEGKAEIISENKNFFLECFRKKDTPCSDEFLLHPKAVLFKVSPLWISFSDYTTKTPKVIELQF